MSIETNVLEPPSACLKRVAPRIPAEVEFQQRNEISGEQLLARFAATCGWDKFQAGKLSKNDWWQLLELTKKDESLARSFLHVHFSSLVDGLYGQARGFNWRDQFWSYESVLGYLIKHRGHAGAVECDAKVLIAMHSRSMRRSPVTGRDCQVLSGSYPSIDPYYDTLFDLYDLYPPPGSRILAHKSVIVAKL